MNILWGLDDRRKAIAKEEKMKRDLVRKMYLEKTGAGEIAEKMDYTVEKVKRILGNASTDDYAAEWERVCEPFRKMKNDVGRA